MRHCGVAICAEKRLRNHRNILYYLHPIAKVDFSIAGDKFNIARSYNNFAKAARNFF